MKPDGWSWEKKGGMDMMTYAAFSFLQEAFVFSFVCLFPFFSAVFLPISPYGDLTRLGKGFGIGGDCA